MTECAVVGEPDDARGAIVKAFVILKANISANDSTTKSIQDHVKAQLAPYKYPRKIEYVESLPKTETGKIQRFKLRQ